jgi:hypothetical protein
MPSTLGHPPGKRESLPGPLSEGLQREPRGQPAVNWLTSTGEAPVKTGVPELRRAADRLSELLEGSTGGVSVW